MHWLLIGYMFLFIHRPFEVWPALGELHIERFYMLFTLVAWVIHSGKRWLPNPQHAAYAGLATAVVACWLVSPWSDQGQHVVEDWFKILVFYVLLVTTIHDEKALKRVAVAFIVIMGIYLAHSLREYLNGRHTFRMGIARLIGVDSTLGDPNSFGAGIVYALPFVAALWRANVGGRYGKVALSGYTGLSVLCLLLTGSRSSLLGLLVWAGILILGSRRRWVWLTAFALAAPVVFVALPDSLQNRFETIVNPEVGPANARESGEGRLYGFLKGFELWGNSPLTGIGPGAWRPATGTKLESHNLYGQLVGELGALGLVAFVAVVACFVWNYRRIARIRREYPEWRNDLVFQIASAVAVALFLLLFMGNFGHNLFRYSWLWYGGFLIIARHCIEQRVRAAQQHAADAEWEAESDVTEEEEWIEHPGHEPAWSR